MNIRQVLYTLLMCSPFMWNQSRAAMLELVLRGDAYVAGQYVYLSDICDVNGVDNEHYLEIANVKIASSPRSGIRKVITRDELNRYISKAKLPERYEIKINGANETHVRLRGENYPVANIESMAREYFVSEMNRIGLSADVNSTSTSDTVELPIGNRLFVPRLSNEYLTDTNCVWVDIYINNELYRTQKIWLASKVKGRVLVAKRRLDAMSEVTANDFYTKEIELSGNPNNYLKTLDREMLLTKEIAADDVIVISNIRPLPDVVYGKTVIVEFSHEGVVIQLNGIAKKSANKGESLSVMLLHNDQIINTRVVGKSRVMAI